MRKKKEKKNIHKKKNITQTITRGVARGRHPLTSVPMVTYSGVVPRLTQCLYRSLTTKEGRT